MPFPVAEVANLIPCNFTLSLRNLCAVLPGGGKICVNLPEVNLPDPMEIAMAFIAQINTALAPLMPVFVLLDVVMALVECILALPKSILPPNPQPIIACIEKLVVTLAALFNLVPLLSIPSTIKALIGAFIAFFQGLRAQIEAIILKRVQINADLASGQSLGIQSMIDAANCNLNFLNAHMANLNEAMAPVIALIKLVNHFLCILGLTPIPTFASIGADTSAAEVILEPIDATIAFLQTVYALIPDITLPEADC